MIHKHTPCTMHHAPWMASQTFFSQAREKKEADRSNMMQRRQQHAIVIIIISWRSQAKNEIAHIMMMMMDEQPASHSSCDASENHAFSYFCISREGVCALTKA